LDYLFLRKLQALEADIEKWKIDYVSLIQSSIRFPSGDGNDDVELHLYGGDKVITVRYLKLTKIFS